MDKLAALRALVTVAECGGFSKAARRLGVAPSSVTRMADALEASLGAVLLVRSTRRVTLTDAGTTYLAQVSRILAELDEADHGIADSGDVLVGTLRVSMPVTYARLALTPHLASFLHDHPGLSLDLVLTDRTLDLASEQIDVAIRIGVPQRTPDLVIRRLAEHRRWLVASADYLRQAGIPRLPSDLEAHQCLRMGYSPDQPRGRQTWRFAKAGQAVEPVDVGGRLLANNADLLLDAARSGLGIAMLSDWLAGDDVKAGRLVRLLDAWQVNPFDGDVCVHAAYLPNRRHSRKLQALLAFLQDRLPIGS